MPAMHKQVLDAMAGRLDGLRDKMVGQIPFEMTHDECLRLVAPSEHIAILKDAAKYADVKSSEQWFYVNVPAVVDGESQLQVNLLMRTHGQKEPPLRPRSPFWQVPTNPEAFFAGEKVIAWATKRLELGRRFGNARWTLYELSNICSTGTEIRYLWPAVMHLCSGQEAESRTGLWAAKHATYKPIRYAPMVSPQLKRAIQDSSTLITSAVLMGEDVEPLDQGEVQINIWSVPSYKFDNIIMSRR